MKTNELVLGVWYTFVPGIQICVMETDEFLKYPEWITQRNTENRIKKKGVIDHLRKLFPTHLIVAVGELTEDDVWEDNVEYKKGKIWRLDANTRGLVWKRGQSDKKPETVLAIKYTSDTLIGLRNIYWAFDNPTATELAAEVVTGIFKSLRYVPQTKKFQDGGIVTALSYTVKYVNPTTFGDRGLWTGPDDDSITIDEFKRSQTLLAVVTYLDTIKAVDELLNECGYNSNFDATFMTALFLFHIKYGPFSDNVKQLCSIIAETATDEDGEIIAPQIAGKGKLNAVSWIARENGRAHDIAIPDRGKMDGFAQGVPFFCYWLSIAKERGLEHKQNQGPQGGYQNWFDTKFLNLTDAVDLVNQVNALEEALAIS